MNRHSPRAGEQTDGQIKVETKNTISFANQILLDFEFEFLPEPGILDGVENSDAQRKKEQKREQNPIHCAQRHFLSSHF